MANAFSNLRDLEEARSARNDPSLKGGGGGGTFDGMEERVKRLEDGVSELRSSMAVMQESVRGLATKADLQTEFGKIASDLGMLNERSAHMLTATELMSAKDAISATVHRQITIVGVCLAAGTLAIAVISPIIAKLLA